MIRTTGQWSPRLPLCCRRQVHNLDWNLTTFLRIARIDIVNIIIGQISISSNISVYNLEMPQYLQLYPPALDWILQCIAQKSPEVSKISSPTNLDPQDVVPYTRDWTMTNLHLYLTFSFQSTLTDILNRCEKECNRLVKEPQSFLYMIEFFLQFQCYTCKWHLCVVFFSALLLNSVITAFKPEYIAER